MTKRWGKGLQHKRGRIQKFPHSDRDRWGMRKEPGGRIVLHSEEKETYLLDGDRHKGGDEEEKLIKRP